METEQERKVRQRKDRDKQLSAVEASLAKAAEAIEDSKREIQRSRDIMRQQSAANARQDKAEDDEDRKH